jgi:hypothetical protein
MKRKPIGENISTLREGSQQFASSHAINIQTQTTEAIFKLKCQWTIPLK